MSDYFDEVADMMAASWSVGRHVGRATIMAALRAKYPSEAALRAAVWAIRADVTQTIENIEADGGQVVGIAQEIPKKGPMQ